MGATGLFVPTVLIEESSAQEVAPNRRRNFVGGGSAGTLHLGLVGAWPMDEIGAVDSVDATGNGWTAVVDGNWLGDPGFAFLGAAGRNGNLSLANRQTGDISANIDTRAASTPFTVRIWAKGNLGSSYFFAAIISQSTQNVTPSQWVLRIDPVSGTKPEFITSDGAGHSTSTSPGIAINGSQWWHYAFGYDGAGNQWFSINGVRTTTALVGGSIGVARGTNPIVINGYNSGSGLGVQAVLLDEAAYWNRSLTQAEVLDDYNGGAGRNYAYVSTH